MAPRGKVSAGFVLEYLKDSKQCANNGDNKDELFAAHW